MNPQTAADLLCYAALAYQDTQPEVPGEKLTVINDGQSGTQCFIRRKGERLLIAFRGTDSLKDRITDLTFCKKTLPYNNSASQIRVHAGFIAAYRSPQVRGVLHRLITDDIKKIRLTGHSLGAALAVLCAVDLQYHFPDKDFEAVVFGCPRVGNRAFKKSYDKRVFKTFRVQNGNDIVTKVPLVFMGYRHVGIKIPIGRPRLLGLFSFHAHRTQCYYQNLWKLI